MKKLIVFIVSGLVVLAANAQDSAKSKLRPLTMAEYEKAKTYTVKDLDKDTYVKFDGNYILDRYEMRKPYFITGDDGLKKRIDIYKLLSKEGMQELGTEIYYTNEKGKVYTAVMPNATTDAKVWDKYFNDIDNINKEEKNFVLKLSYVLSKEMSFQLYKVMNGGQAKGDDGTYGTDICFPGNQEVAMADGSRKLLQNIRPGDQVISVNPTTKQSSVAQVKELVKHEAKNYAITKLLVVSATEKRTVAGIEVVLSSKVLAATPNHPMNIGKVRKPIGKIAIGEKLICLNEQTKRYETYTVYQKTEAADGMQQVYNMVLSSGGAFTVNDVMVLQK
jgi:hypothetical protein